MYKLEFTLKQHTPIIHFQHNQKGATLRATEVKPKLDRFIIEKMNVDGKTIPKGWFIGEHEALDYKINITGNADNYEKIENDHTNSPMYFGNMGNENPPKHLKFSEILEGTTFSKHFDLCKEISKHIADFFFLNNFGSRQSKGYGSFSIEKYTMNAEEWIFPEVDTTKYLNIEFAKIAESDLKKKYILPFRKIDWFYRSLRSGINYKGLYFKSALFMYLYYQKKTQWDKKTIKAQYFNNIDQSLIEFNKKKQKNISVNIHYQKTQSTNHNNPDILI
ncbi:MAG TPA: hypothetical protein DCQ58_07230, partial [Saprospirales bacterium]|nr:hypothetical protein [Saprospirales bacterium]